VTNDMRYIEQCPKKHIIYIDHEIPNRGITHEEELGLLPDLVEIIFDYIIDDLHAMTYVSMNKSTIFNAKKKRYPPIEGNQSLDDKIAIYVDNNNEGVRNIEHVIHNPLLFDVTHCIRLSSMLLRMSMYQSLFDMDQKDVDRINTRTIFSYSVKTSVEPYQHIENDNYEHGRYWTGVVNFHNIMRKEEEQQQQGYIIPCTYNHKTEWALSIISKSMLYFLQHNDELSQKVLKEALQSFVKYLEPGYKFTEMMPNLRSIHDYETWLNYIKIIIESGYEHMIDWDAMLFRHKPNYNDPMTLKYFKENCISNKTAFLHSFCEYHVNSHTYETANDICFPLLMEYKYDDSINWEIIIYVMGFRMFYMDHLDFFYDIGLNPIRLQKFKMNQPNYYKYMIKFLHEEKKDYDLFYRVWKYTFQHDEKYAPVRNPKKVSIEVIKKLRTWYKKKHGKNNWYQAFCDDYSQCKRYKVVELGDDGKYVTLFDPVFKKGEKKE